MLLQAYPVLLEQRAISQGGPDQNVFSLNISQLDLPSIDEPAVSEGYEECLTSMFRKPEDVTFNSVLLFLIANPTFARYGFHKGFGKMFFNLMVLQRKQEKWLTICLLKVHLLEIRDPVFLSLQSKLLESNAVNFAQ